MIYNLVYNVIILMLLSTISHGDEARGTKLTHAEDEELNRQLTTLNKPPIKTFKLNGDIIDCVNIYKQPAFDHPLLKNHKLQTRPNFVPKSRNVREENSAFCCFCEHSDSSILSKKVNKNIFQREFEGCPNGTVPLRRTQKKDLIMAKEMLDLRRSRSIYPNSGLLPGMHYAALTTKIDDPPMNFYGARTRVGVYNLTVQGPQFTEVMLWIGNGVNGPYNSVEFGWMVNPLLFGDGQARTYGMWTGDGLQNTGCYNAQCPGYVQVSQTRFIGAVVNEVNELRFKLVKDEKTSNWLLLENLEGNLCEFVGYWPKELFPTMTDHATIIQLGGKVYNAPAVSKPAPMGSGAFGPNDPKKTCYASDIFFIDSKFEYVTPDGVPIDVLEDVPNMYKAKLVRDSSEEHMYTLLFGGPN